MMEHVYFIKFLKEISPHYKKISRAAVKNECMNIYHVEKKRLHNLLKGIRKICITTDLWKSGKRFDIWW